MNFYTLISKKNYRFTAECASIGAFSILTADSISSSETVSGGSDLMTFGPAGSTRSPRSCRSPMMPDTGPAHSMPINNPFPRISFTKGPVSSRFSRAFKMILCLPPPGESPAETQCPRLLSQPPWRAYCRRKSYHAYPA